MVSMQQAERGSSSTSTGPAQLSFSCNYEHIAAADLPNVESLGYVLGKTLGSGTYAKVKSAWSMSDRKLVSSL